MSEFTPEPEASKEFREHGTCVPIYEVDNEWYVEGVGFVDSKWLWSPNMPDEIETERVERTAHEITAWAEVREHLDAGGDIMNIVVPHEDEFDNPKPISAPPKAEDVPLTSERRTISATAATAIDKLPRPRPYIAAELDAPEAFGKPGQPPTQRHQD